VGGGLGLGLEAAVAAQPVIAIINKAQHAEAFMLH